MEQNRSKSQEGPRPGAHAGVDRVLRPRREVSSAELLGGGREIYIRHAGEIYTLRQTSNGKLILTK